MLFFKFLHDLAQVLFDLTHIDIDCCFLSIFSLLFLNLLYAFRLSISVVFFLCFVLLPQCPAISRNLQQNLRSLFKWYIALLLSLTLWLILVHLQMLLELDDVVFLTFAIFIVFDLFYKVFEPLYADISKFLFGCSIKGNLYFHIRIEI